MRLPQQELLEQREAQARRRSPAQAVVQPATVGSPEVVKADVRVCQLVQGTPQKGLGATRQEVDGEHGGTGVMSDT